MHTHIEAHTYTHTHGLPPTERVDAAAAEAAASHCANSASELRESELRLVSVTVKISVLSSCPCGRSRLQCGVRAQISWRYCED